MIIAIIQARMNSSRLSGKVLRPLAGIASLKHVYDRVSRSKYIGKVVVATSTGKLDDRIAEFCVEYGIYYYRGKEEDVLDRFYQCAMKQSLKADDTIVRITADCPLIDPMVIDKIIENYNASGVDYASNTLVPTYPDGLDAEVFSYKALEKAWNDAKLPSEREHVTPYIKKNESQFKILNVSNDVDYSDLRWTIDEHLDYKLIQLIYNELYEKKQNFDMGDVIAFLEEKPNLKIMNKQYSRDEGYQQSLVKDAELNGILDAKRG